MADQCEHTGARGRCPHPKVDGSEFCSQHSNEQSRIRGYQLSDPNLREKYEQFRKTDIYAAAEEEVHLLHAFLEDRINMANGPAERLALFNSVGPAIERCVKCLQTISKLKSQNNIVLGKESLSKFMDEIIDILFEELDGTPEIERIVDKVAKRTAEALANARN